MIPKISRRGSEHLLSEAISREMSHHTEIRIHGRTEEILFFLGESSFLSSDLITLSPEMSREASLDATSYIHPIRLDEGSEKNNSFIIVLERYLSRMEIEREGLRYKLSNTNHTLSKILRILMDEKKIIDISTIVSDLQSLFDEGIEWMKIEICEDLTCEIADRQTDTMRRVEETLISRESHPLMTISLDDTIFSRVIEEDFLTQGEKQPLIGSLIFRGYKVR